MAYAIEYLPAAERAIKSLDHRTQVRILAKIETLRDNPRPAGSVKLSGQESYRIRAGDYRIIYNIHDARLIVLIVDIGHRRDVYRRM